MAEKWNDASELIQRIELLREALSDSIDHANRVIETARTIQFSDNIRQGAALRKLERTSEAMHESTALIG